ncbi:MAG: glycosyltransferase family 9 protein [Bacteroidales bacterium]|nr:glycosyltransferase family 9 protein [Bacteroidales bacterium]
MFKRILVIQTASLGDVILATAVLEKLHTYYPEARLDFLIKKGYEGLFEGHPYLNRLWIWDKKEHKYAKLRQIIQEIRGSHFDLVVNLQRFAATGLITSLSKASVRIGFSKNPFSLFFTKSVKHQIGKTGMEVHETRRNQNLIASLTDDQAAKPALYPSKEDYAKVSVFKTRAFICIAPASLWFTKQFPEEKWVQFLQQLDPELYVYLLGSEADKDLCNRIISASGHANSINLAGKLSLLESAALMRDARMNFVNDSAPMHLCSAMDAPVTAIYCSTVTDFGFGPLSTKSFIVETTEKLTCRPCGLHGWQSCPKKHFRCATTISVNQLLKHL